MKLLPIASSSSGNAYVVEHEGFVVLIDCGVAYKRIKDFAVDAVLVTHSHTDHTSGLKALLKYRDVPVYANLLTAESIACECGIANDAFVCFENGQRFDIGPFGVLPFSIPHDTADPVGYLVRAGGETYFHGTDIGTPLDSVGLMLAEADVAILESNHDPELLRASGRPPCLIQRIAGPRGHLSNDDAADLVRRFASSKLKRLYLAHLSHQCNDPSLARATMTEALKSIGRDDVELEVLS